MVPSVVLGLAASTVSVAGEALDVGITSFARPKSSTLTTPESVAMSCP